MFWPTLPQCQGTVHHDGEGMAVQGSKAACLNTSIVKNQKERERETREKETEAERQREKEKEKDGDRENSPPNDLKTSHRAPSQDPPHFKSPTTGTTSVTCGTLHMSLWGTFNIQTMVVGLKLVLKLLCQDHTTRPLHSSSWVQD